MEIAFQNLLPQPLTGKPVMSQVWHSEVKLPAGFKAQFLAGSGKGKTTLICMLYGIRTDYEGVITINGKDIRSISQDQWAVIRQKEISIVFQDLRLFYDFTGMENILIKSQLTGFCTESAIIEMSKRLGVDEILSKKCGLMSWGEKQRIAIIRALVQPFKWLFLDEPFSHLDKANALCAYTLIMEQCAKQGAGFIITSLDEDTTTTYDFLARI